MLQGRKHFWAALGVMASVGAVGLCPMAASAALVTYSGQDNPATVGGANPVSAAAALAFDTAVAGLGASSLITFEGATLGGFSNLAIAPGVTMSGSDFSGANQTIRNTTNFPAGPTLDGYNTTSGGSYFVEMLGGTVTFSFTTAIQAFGAYFSGVQTNFFADEITFSDGTSQSLLIPGAGTSNSVGALSFVGFTDVGKSITSVTIRASGLTSADFMGIDDVRFQLAPTGVPEPGSLALVLGAGFGLLATRKRR
jgi:hypothetical protein